jgi:hypothetical protein
LIHASAWTIDNYRTGAAAASMAGLSVMRSGFWSLWNNQAGLGFHDQSGIGFHHENRFMVPELALSAIGITRSTSTGTFGLSLTRFGCRRYNENKIGLALGRAFHRHFSAGLQLNYLSRFIDSESGYAGSVNFEAGIIAEPLTGFFIGVHLYNPAGPGSISNTGLKAPGILRLGMGYRFDSRLFLGMETEHTLRHRVPVFRAGVEYRLIDYIYLRSGLSLQDYVQHSFGLGFTWKNLRTDLAFSYQQIAGYTPHLSLQYDFR